MNGICLVGESIVKGNVPERDGYDYIIGVSTRKANNNVHARSHAIGNSLYDNVDKQQTDNNGNNGPYHDQGSRSSR